MDLENQLIRVPFEVLSRTFRNNQKMVERELTHATAAVSEMATSRRAVTPEDAAKSLDQLIRRLQATKRKVEENARAEEKQVQSCRARLSYLSSIAPTGAAQTVDDGRLAGWNRLRLERLIADQMLRDGRYDSAASLARESNITELIDLDVFLAARKALEGLARHDCTDAIAWCTENRSRLRKLENNLEFDLRLQEYIELIRQRKLRDAVVHARKHLATLLVAPAVAPAAAGEGDGGGGGGGIGVDPLLQEAMALLAVTEETTCEKYRHYFDASRWTLLLDRFRAANCAVHGMPLESPLSLSLQAGLAVLKTPQCVGALDRRNPNCPVCSEPFASLAERLPSSMHLHSDLVCAISGQLMDADNPPLVFPNGYSYSTAALRDMAAKNAGIVRCPRSGETCRFDELRKAFIL